MCSQPIVQDAQLLRATLRRPVTSPAGCSARSAAPSKAAAWKLRVGRALIALNASRLASVPSSRYFAVAGPNDRAGHGDRNRNRVNSCAVETLYADACVKKNRTFEPAPDM